SGRHGRDLVTNPKPWRGRPSPPVLDLESQTTDLCRIAKFGDEAVPLVHMVKCRTFLSERSSKPTAPDHYRSTEMAGLETIPKWQTLKPKALAGTQMGAGAEDQPSAAQRKRRVEP